MKSMNLCEIKRNMEKSPTEKVVEVINEAAEVINAATIILAKRAGGMKIERIADEVLVDCGIAVETIEHKGLFLHKVDRKAREGDYIRPNETTGQSLLEDGRIYGPVLRDAKGVPVVNHNGTNFNVYEKSHNRTCENTEVFKVVGKTINRQRAELIQRAKNFIKVKENSLQNSPDIEGGYEVKRRENPKYCTWMTKVEFIVNVEERVVVALLKGAYDRKLFSKGIAKCAPDDVFHADIGKAIALARALEIDIPTEFLNAVQPDEIVLGMVIKYPSGEKSIVTDGNTYPFTETHINVAREYGNEIIDDTNAKYGTSEVP